MNPEVYVRRIGERTHSVMRVMGKYRPRTPMDDHLVPCSCLHYRAQIWANPVDFIGGSYDFLAFDLLPPKAVGDVSFLMYHDCRDDEEDDLS